VAQFGDSNDLNPRVSRRKLPPRFARKRTMQAGTNEADRERYEATIDAHLAAHMQALAFLAEEHQRIADSHDFDLVGDTRPAALWQMAGRCIGIARLILDAVGLGYTAEPVHLARVLHEADRLLDMFADPEESPLLQQWLDDEKWVRPASARKAEARFEQRLADAMAARGEPELDRTKERTQRLYAEFSGAAHNRRRWVEDAVAPELRTMLRGPTTVWARRATTAAVMVAVVEEAVITVGGTLDLFLGEGWYRRNVTPHIAALSALRSKQPLP
jgi:hypothetical protein